VELVLRRLSREIRNEREINTVSTRPQLTTQADSRAVPASATERTSILQRKYACGNHAVAGGGFDECRKKPGEELQRKAAAPIETNGVPPIVYETLNSPGSSQSAEMRGLFEPMGELM